MRGDMVDSTRLSESRARWDNSRPRALLRDIFAIATQHPQTLISFDEIRERLCAREQLDRGVRVIPVGDIVGSVNKVHDFTREFLPRNERTRERWLNVDHALNQLETLPPIEV